MPSEPASKRIPKSLTTEPTLLGPFTLEDLVIGLAPGIGLFLLGRSVLSRTRPIFGLSPDIPLVIIGGLGILLGFTLVYLTPMHTSTVDWLVSWLGYRGRPHRLEHAASGTQTQVARIHRNHNAVVRNDGAVIGVVQVMPPSMGLATEAEWAETVTCFRDFLNAHVSFPIQIFSTTREFPIDRYLTHYQDRLNDADVTANPKLKHLIRAYVDWYEGEVHRRQMTIRDHYVIVTVVPSEVRADTDRVMHKLGRLPYLGGLLSLVGRDHRLITRDKQLSLLHKRLNRITVGLESIPGCSAVRIDPEDTGQLIAEFWTDHSRRTARLDGHFRTTPIVRGADS